MSLAEDHRPRVFEDVVGHDAAVAYLRDEARKRTGRSVLLYGPAGCGKTTLAEIYGNALLCQCGQGSPCLECDDCHAWKEGRHWNMHRLEPASDYDRAVIQGINEDVVSASLSGGWHVILIDNAEALSKAALDALHDRMERPPPKTAFILCASEIDKVPEKTKSLLRLFEIGPVDMPTRLELLHRICERAGFAFDEEALDLLARKTGGLLRTLIRDLEAVEHDGAITLEGVRAYYGLDRPQPVERYMTRLLDESGFDAQQAALLDEWNAPPERKVRDIVAYFASLYDTEILRPGHVDPSLGAATLEERRRIAAELTARAERLGIETRRFWQEIKRFWADAGQATEPVLIRMASDFDELLNGPGGDRIGSGAEGLVRRRRRPPVRTLRTSSGAAAVSADSRLRAGVEMYLPKDKVQALWDAASFLVQEYGLLLNTRISIRYASLGCPDPNEAVRLLTELTHELRQLVKIRAATDEHPEPFHWLYVHEHRDSKRLRTHLVAHVPEQAGDIEGWLRSEFLPRRKLAAPPAGLRVWRAPAAGGQHLRQHFRLLRFLSRGLNPAIPALVRKEGQAVAPKYLIDVLKVPCRLRGPVGRRITKQRTGVSRYIDRGARAVASTDLPVLSAFEKRAWSELDTGWEFAEHEYRAGLKREREAEQRRIDKDFPANKGLLCRAQHDQEMKKFLADWISRIDDRERNRPRWRWADEP